MQKYIGLSTLILLQIVIVGNLQILPITAQYGYSLPFLCLLAIIGFVVPCVLMVSELTARFPQTGGAYLWSEHAFGKSVGFFTATIIWLSNLLWYPSIFSLIATSMCYIYSPDIANNKILIVSLAVGFFWGITLLNFTGVRLSSRFSAICAVMGILFPIFIILVGGIIWCVTKQPLAISTQATPLLPHLNNIANLGMLISVVTLFFGLEMTAAHAGNVENPKRNFPRSVWISAAILIVVMSLSSLAIALIVPTNKLSSVSGLLDAIGLLFQYLHASIWFKPMCALIFIGNLGSVTAWMLSATRSMWVASCQNYMPHFFQKVNRSQAPTGILFIEACVFSVAMSVFLFFPHLTDSYWLLLDLAAQLTLVYYLFLFVAAMRLRHQANLLSIVKRQNHHGRLQVAATIKNNLFIVLMLLGVLTCVGSFFVGFISPPDITGNDVLLFKWMTRLGMMLALCVPAVLMIFRHVGATRRSLVIVPRFQKNIESSAADLQNGSKVICVYCGAHCGTNPVYATAARQLGETIARQGLTLVYGGSNLGTMGEVASSALASGGTVIGVMARDLLLVEPTAINLTKLYLVDTIAERKEMMITLADGFITLPGGAGTLDEFADTFSRIRLGDIQKSIGLLNIEHYYDYFENQLNVMVRNGFLTKDYPCFLKVSDDIDDLLRFVIAGQALKQPRLKVSS